MSTYDDSSLFLYPSGYKASVLFAQKPMDANGQLAFTRSNDTASRVASNGLIERVRTNLVAYSEQFDNAAWLKNGITVTANATTAPNGTMTADKVVDTLGGNNAYRIFNSVTLSAISYSASFYVKAAEYSWVYIRIGNALRVWFDVSTGVVGINDTGITGTIQSAGNGWYRCTAIIATATAGSGFSLLGLTNANGVEAYTPSTGGQGVFVWGAQLETGDIATDYIATTTAARSVGPLANIPRIDYLGGGCGKLLLEPQRTNTILWSEQINTTNWPSSTRINVTENALVSPDGYQNADLIIPNTTSGNHGPAQNVSSLTSGATYSCSIYAKAQGYSKFLILAGAGTGSGQYEFDLTAGTAQAGATITSVGNGWYRCTAPLVPNSSLLQYLIFISNGSAYSYAGNGTSGIAFWGAQLEAGAYATSYIPTLAASVTRGADLAQKSSISSLFGANATTLVLDFVKKANTTGWTITGGNGSKLFSLAQFDTTAGIPRIVFDDGVDTSSTLAALSNGRHKIAVSYATNDTRVYIDGALVFTDTACTYYQMDRIGVNATAWTGFTNNTNAFEINQFLMIPAASTNAQLAELTTI